MINVYNLTPQIYYDNSRDFQLTGRVCEIMLNYILMNIDLIKGIPLNDNTSLSYIDLLLLTLGFSKTHEYTSVDMLRLARAFKSLVKIKGTKESIEDCINILLSSQHLEKDYYVKINTLTLSVRNRETSINDLYTMDIYLPQDTKDIVLLEDIFEYILPAGFVYNIYRTSGRLSDVSDYFYEQSNYVIQSGSNSSTLFGQIADSQHLPDAYRVSDYARTNTTVVTNSSSIIRYVEPEIQPTSETFEQNKYYIRSTDAEISAGFYEFTLASEFKDDTIYYIQLTVSTNLNEVEGGEHNQQNTNEEES